MEHFEHEAAVDWLLHLDEDPCRVFEGRRDSRPLGLRLYAFDFEIDLCLQSVLYSVAGGAGCTTYQLVRSQ